jgi:hypothetical protein
MNKLWIFEVWSIASSKTCVGCTKTVIQDDLQLEYISGLLQWVFSSAGLLFAYLQEWGIAGFRKTTLYNILEPTKAVVPIPDLYLVLHLSMHYVQFKCIGVCVSRWVVEHASHDKVSGLGTTTLWGLPSSTVALRVTP